jgi:hypothetical protein
MKVNDVEYNTYKVYFHKKGTIVPRLIAYGVSWDKAVEIQCQNPYSYIAPVLDEE